MQTEPMDPLHLVDPETLLFSQDSIGPCFRTGSPLATAVTSAKSYAQSVTLGEQLLLSKVGVCSSGSNDGVVLISEFLGC